ncbi:MAG: alpha-galactosidase [Kineosporiaceae bacterium]
MTAHLLRGGGAALVVDVPGDGLPRVLHWGADLGDVGEADLATLRAASVTAIGVNLPDVPSAPTIVPGEADGWFGRPGLSAHRGGRPLYPRWTMTDVAAGDGSLRVAAADAAAAVRLTIAVELDAAGVVTVRLALHDDGDPADPLQVTGLVPYLPVPHAAHEVLDLTGRWGRERSPQRSAWLHGGRVRESRRGRTGHDATLLLALGTPGFGFRSGEVWAVHAAWSGDHVHLAERLPDGAGPHAGLLGAGELLRPGEVAGSYLAPPVHFAWSGHGLDGISAAFHRHLRARPQHPRRPRPVTLNSWEAVYFDHGPERLARLAEAAASVGVERFVLDDGWFGARRDDTRGLGDWTVAGAVWPDGLEPLAARVRELGMEFGLWVEPEMVNLDSDLVRAHPDWVLAATDGTDGTDASDLARLPPPSRHQYALDLTNPDASAHILGRLDALVADLGIAYLKWDHNRDLAEAVGTDGRAGVHAQTAAFYALVDELRRRHPGLEIESCSSGGARIDLGVLARTDRVWTSDMTDALERQVIQRWTGVVVPPELLGAHVSAPESHQTGRQLALAFRCLTAFFGHAGIEWDVSACDGADLDRLRRWVGLHRRHRELLHSGTVVHGDEHGPGTAGQWLHGVVASDDSRALYAFVQLTTSPDAVPGRHRLPGLDPARRYAVEVVDLTGDGLPPAAAGRQVPWIETGRIELSGAILASVGLPMPALQPAQGVLLHVTAVG